MHLRNIVAGHSYLTNLEDPLAWHSCRALLLGTFVGDSWLCFPATLLQNTPLGALSWHASLTHLWDSLAWHSLLDTFVGRSCWAVHFCGTPCRTPMLDNIGQHYCRTLLPTLVGHSYLPLFCRTAWLDTLTWHVCLLETFVGHGSAFSPLWLGQRRALVATQIADAQTSSANVIITLATQVCSTHFRDQSGSIREHPCKGGLQGPRTPKVKREP